MEIQINEILIEPKIWQLFYHFEQDKNLMSELFTSKSHQSTNNCFFLNEFFLKGDNLIENIDLIRR